MFFSVWQKLSVARFWRSLSHVTVASGTIWLAWKQSGPSVVLWILIGPKEDPAGPKTCCQWCIKQLHNLKCITLRQSSDQGVGHERVSSNDYDDALEDTADTMCVHGASLTIVGVTRLWHAAICTVSQLRRSLRLSSPMDSWLMVVTAKSKESSEDKPKVPM